MIVVLAVVLVVVSVVGTWAIVEIAREDRRSREVSLTWREEHIRERRDDA